MTTSFFFGFVFQQCKIFCDAGSNLQKAAESSTPCMMAKATMQGFGWGTQTIKKAGGNLSAALTDSDATKSAQRYANFKCPEFGRTLHTDTPTSRNILQAGHSQTCVRGVSSSYSL